MSTSSIQTYNRNRGFSLVESIVAVSISGMVVLFLAMSLAEQMRLSTTSQNQLLASSLAREVLERIRATPFDKLPAEGVTNQIRIASGDADDSAVYDTSFKLLSRPLQIDGLNMIWRSAILFGMPQTKFGGKVFLTMGPRAIGPNGPIPETKTAKVIVTWEDKGPKQISVQTILCRYGIQLDQ